MVQLWELLVTMRIEIGNTEGDTGEEDLDQLVIEEETAEDINLATLIDIITTTIIIKKSF